MKISRKTFLPEMLPVMSQEGEIVIFGAGKNGIILSNLLKKYDIVVDYFCDNDSKKWYQIFDGIPCISYAELKRLEENPVIFVSPQNADEIYRQLSEDRFKAVVPKVFMDVVRYLPEKNIDLIPVDHFYSPYPDFKYLEEHIGEVFDNERECIGIDLNDEGQCDTVRKMTVLYDSLLAWEDLKKQGDGVHKYRYKYNNSAFERGDAVALHCMLRMLKPEKVIEVGSGYSSAMLLDTNEYFMNGQISCSFIEPYPDLLRSLCKKTDKINLKTCRLQEVELGFFKQLNENDILFIDSTHVMASGSDVNYVLFEILPRLNPGVYIHFHDIFWPFEYPKSWVMQGPNIWNELYGIRAFLLNNDNYKIELFYNYMEKKHKQLLKKNWPYEVEPFGGSLWLRKIR